MKFFALPQLNFGNIIPEEVGAKVFAKRRFSFGVLGGTAYCLDKGNFN